MKSREVIPLLEDMIGHIEEQQSLMAELYQELEERDEQLLALQERERASVTERLEASKRFVRERAR